MTKVKDTLARASLTFLEALMAFLTVGTPIFDLDWKVALAVSATAFVITIGKQLIIYLKDYLKNRGIEVLDDDDEYEEGDTNE